MTESTLALDFEDLILRVAEHLGLAVYAASTAAAIPTDVHDLDLCKRLVNEGWRRFYNSNPKWNWPDRNIDITMDSAGTTDRVVDETIWRYYMPDGFYGHVLSPFTYAENEGKGPIIEVREDQIRDKHAHATTTDWPREYALRRLTDDPKRRWEMIVWPGPSANDVLTGRVRLYPNRLIELTDKPNAGVEFDEAIVAACLAQAENEKEDAQAIKESQWAEALTRAVAIDQGSAPRRLGYNADGSDGPRERGRTWFNGVDTYTNIDGTVTTC